MLIPSSMPRLKGYRFPREVVAYAVWAYHRFALSAADVEDLLAERGVIVNRELGVGCGCGSGCGSGCSRLQVVAGRAIAAQDEGPGSIVLGNHKLRLGGRIGGADHGHGGMRLRRDCRARRDGKFGSRIRPDPRAKLCHTRKYCETRPLHFVR